MMRETVPKTRLFTLMFCSVASVFLLTGCNEKKVSKLMRCDDRTVTPIDMITKGDKKSMVVYMDGKGLKMEHIETTRSDIYRSEKPIISNDVFLTLAIRNNQALYLHETRITFAPPKRELIKTCSMK